MAQRIKGQEVDIIMLVDGQPRDNFSLARSFDISFKTDMLQEGYLGETTDRYDTIYKGVAGKISFHLDNTEVFNIIRFIVNKARRREPGTKFNIKSTLNFPNGQRARVIVRDAEFGELPISFGSRSDYGEFNLDYGASEAQILPL